MFTSNGYICYFYLDLSISSNVFFCFYNEFLNDLEEDPDMRQNVNIYKDSHRVAQVPVDENDMEDPSVPQITLEEMLDDLVIEDIEMTESS